MSKKDFTNTPRRKKTLGNKQIEDVASDMDTPKKSKESTVRFAIRIPESIHARLERTAQRLGMSKKAIMMLGLNDQLEKLDK